MEEFTVLVDIEEQEEYENALSRAKELFNTVDSFASRYRYCDIHSSENKLAAIVELESEEGQSLVEDRLHQTHKAKLTLLNKMESAINSVETIDNTLADTDLFELSRQFGSWSHPSNYLIDGTSWQFGDPLLTTEDLQEVKDHYSDQDHELVLVNVKVK